MATYKVIQDIEAEDHILGPLSLRQFVYGIISVLFLYVCYLVIHKHVAFLLPLFLLPALFFGFFAWPWGQDQPTEVWALAKIRFLFKPRRRIWDQSGVKELVTITAPKQVEEHLTNGLSQNEVQSRLNALASTIDSRGWAIKNVNLNLYSQPPVLGRSTVSDRLIDPSTIPQEVPNYDVQASDDILDEHNNPIAQQFDQMIQTQAQAHRQQLVSQLNAPPGSPAPATMPTPQNYWFLEQPVQPPQLAKDQSVFTKAQVVMPGSDDTDQTDLTPKPTADEAALAEQLKAQSAKPEAYYGHMRTVQPIDARHPAAPAPAPMTPAPDPAKINLARRDDLNVATIARIANKQDEPPEDEVVISLH
jgi:hypothetical protein